ncbi:UNVERIFIED_ORG: FAD binding domain protein [Clostridioides difficile F501]
MHEQEGVTRRSFIAGAGTLAALAAAGLAGCSPSAQSNAGTQEEQGSIELKQADSTRECDVVVVGLGASGLMAAYGAASKGASVIAIDTGTNMAATTNVRTSGAWCVGSKLQKEAGGDPLTIQEAMDHINNGTNYQSNQKTLRAILGASGRAIDILVENGMEFRTDFDKTGSEATINTRGVHWYNLTGDDRAAVFQAVADNAGVECLFGTIAENIIMENGSATGVQCSSGSNVVDIKAKAIIMCSGGFLGNPDLVAERFAGAKIVVMGNPSCTGAGIDMAIEAGAQLGKCFSISMNEYGGANDLASPTYAFRPGTGSNDALRLTVFGGLMVDAEGDRFINEGFVCERCMFAAEPFVREKYHYAVADSAFINRLSTEPASEFFGDERMKGMFAETIMSDLVDQFDKAIEEGWAFKADTIAELGQHFDLTNLEETTRAYNAACEAGADELFFKDAKYLSALTEPPFYIVQSQPAGWLSLGGIKSNASFQALDADGKPIPGVYVAGVDADLFTSPYYQMASANAFALSSGLIAGEAAGEAI